MEYGCFSVERLFRDFCGVFRHIATPEDFSEKLTTEGHIEVSDFVIQDAFSRRSATQTFIIDCLGTPKRLASLSSN